MARELGGSYRDVIIQSQNIAVHIQQRYETDRTPSVVFITRINKLLAARAEGLDDHLVQSYDQSGRWRGDGYTLASHRFNPEDSMCTERRACRAATG